jgi:hypothetical protein
MPVSFRSLKEARNIWSVIMRPDYHFILLALTRSKSRDLGGPWRDKDGSEWEGSANMLPGENMFCACNIPAIELYP